MSKEQLKLLDQIIEHAKILDRIEKEKAIKEHQGEKAIGESWLLHHLRILRNSLEE